MSGYTLEQLSEEGSPFAMAMLLRAMDYGEPFVTYGEIREELEHQLGIDKIFPTHIGYVAGPMMNKILEWDSDAPLINMLITRPNGIPGDGVGGYVAWRYNNNRFKDWGNISSRKKRQLVNEERQKVFTYGAWQELNRAVFGEGYRDALRPLRRTEQDGKPPQTRGYGGEAESEEHWALKNWVAEHPEEIGVGKGFGKGETEAPLLSGDSIDVLFQKGDKFVTVEVKSRLSNREDLRRGIYQCLKYAHIKYCEHYPNQANVRSILVTENKPDNELISRARLLKVKIRNV